MIRSIAGLIVFVLCIVIGTYRAAAQSLDSQLKNGMALVYQQRFDQADSLLMLLEKQHPASVQVHLFGVNLYWHKWVMGDHQDALQKRFYHELDVARILLKQAQKASKTSHEITYAWINYYGFLARMDGIQKHYWRAFQNIRACVHHLQTSFGSEGHYEPFRLSTGIYHLYASNASSRYPLLRPYLNTLPAHRREQGLYYLEQASRSSDPVVSAEAHYFLMKWNLDEGHPENALPSATQLCNRYPGNSLFRFYHMQAHIALKQTDAAERDLQKLLAVLSTNPELNAYQKKHLADLAKEMLRK